MDSVDLPTEEPAIDLGGQLEPSPLPDEEHDLNSPAQPPPMQVLDAAPPMPIVVGGDPQASSMDGMGHGAGLEDASGPGFTMEGLNRESGHRTLEEIVIDDS